MKPMKGNRHDVIKAKRENLFQRFSRRISKYFNRSKQPEVSPSYSNEIPITAASHENLYGKNKKVNKSNLFGGVLNIPEINTRCMSEGDISREKGQFYSQDPSPSGTALRAYESNRNYSRNDENNRDSQSFRNSFKAELSLKLKPKNQRKGEESDLFKTPDSTIVSGVGISPSKPFFGDARTPWSMSSLSHSSNSLLSSTVANNYGTSDGESMSRSVIDPTDELGIVVDMTTPISKTTHAALLDSTAARQKISASKARRTKPKAPSNLTSEKVSSEDSAKFSPIREKRDPLEEISEEEYLQPFSIAFKHLSPTKQDCGIRDSIISYVSPLEQRQELRNYFGETTSSCNFQKPQRQNSEKTETQQKCPVKLRYTNSSTVVKQPNKIGNTPTGDSYLSLKINTTPRANETNKVGEQAINLRAYKGKVVNPPSSDSVYSTKAAAVLPQSAPKISQHNPATPSKFTKCDPTPAPSITTDETRVMPTATTGFSDRRSSRVLDMLKNFESVPCADCP